MLKSITAEEAARLLQDGAMLVDIREPDEHARTRIPGARNLPLSRLEEASLALHQGKPVLFHCKSGARTEGHVGRLAARAGDAEAYIVAGGLDAWKRAGLPVAEDRRQPIEVMRQVQITAGALVLIGVLVGSLVSPWGYAISGFVGAGLVFAGVSGTCAMATMLRAMPWNRRATPAAAS